MDINLLIEILFQLYPNTGHSIYEKLLMHERMGRGMTDFLLHDCYGYQRTDNVVTTTTNKNNEL